MNKYRQSLIMLAATVASFFLPVLTSHLSPSELINTVLLALGTIQVWVAANLTEGLWRQTKVVVAGIMASAVVFQSVISNGISGDEWKQIAAAFIGVVLAAILKNRPVVTAAGPDEGPRAARHAV